MSQAQYRLNALPLRHRSTPHHFADEKPERPLGPYSVAHNSVAHKFEQLSQLYCELASKVTEADILHHLAQVLPSMLPCDRLSYAVPHPQDERFDVMVFDGRVSQPLSFPLAWGASSLTEVMMHPKATLQRTNSSLYADDDHGTWVSCHIPLKVNGALLGILNVASHALINDVEECLPLFCSVGEFLSQTFARIQHQAQADVLLPPQTEHPHQVRKPFALLFVNLDEFRAIPEAQPLTLSPEVRSKWGDRLQEQVTDCLHAQLRDGDVISRVGRTEFVIALRSNPLLNVPQVASRLANIFEQPIFLEDQEFHVSCSIGISFYPADGHTTDELIQKADLAMQAAKAQRSGNVKLYQSEVSDAISRRLQIEQGLRDPKLRQHLNIVYQPQWNCEHDRLYGFECLVRWQHPTLGSISPTEFIPIAEELGCIQTITHLALAQALKLTRQILDTYDIIVRPSVNVSASEFDNMQVLYEMTNQLLHEYQLPGDLLTIELTERVFLEQSDKIISHMTRFQDRGIRISLDDFGTGFSSLNYLLELPLNSLKIDRAFVQNIHQDQKRRGVVQAIATMAKSLDMRCLAEGVETQAELDCLQAFGCGLIQGHIVAPALSSDSFLDFIAASQVQSAMNLSR